MWVAGAQGKDTMVKPAEACHVGALTKGSLGGATLSQHAGALGCLQTTDISNLLRVLPHPATRSISQKQVLKLNSVQIVISRGPVSVKHLADFRSGLFSFHEVLLM